MTLFLWDTSHYDGALSRATLATAHAHGIVALTHKVGEGTGGDDPLDGPVLAAARDAGIPLLGGYYVVRSGPVGPQVDECIALADRDEPWWREFPGWFWQCDLERWQYDSVPAATGIAFGTELRRRTGRVVAMYASHGQYGDQLAGWDGPLWNAHYVNGAGDFRTLYPGDHWYPAMGSGHGGWSAYSGREPDFLQYTSSATIAGVTTSDASAYRGSLAQLNELLTGGGDMATPVFVREQDGPNKGRVWVCSGPTRYHLPSPAALAEALAGFGLTEAAVRNILAARLDAYGVDVATIGGVPAATVITFSGTGTATLK